MEALANALHRLQRRAGAEHGVTLAETMMALMIFTVALVALVSTATIGLTYTAFARQRQWANQISNQLEERIRGLAYDALKYGLNTQDLAGDPNVKLCSGVYYFKSCPTQDASAERIVNTPGLPNVDPLVPHRGTMGPPNYTTTYSYSTYVTYAANAPVAGAYRVTVIVSWTNPQVRGAAKSLQVQSLVYSPNGCVDTATHPFAAPCQAFFYALGGIDSGGVQTTGTVPGLSFDSFSVDLLNMKADMQIEQVNRVSGGVTLPGALLKVGDSATKAGRQASSSSATDDPADATPVYQIQPNPNLAQTGGTVRVSNVADGQITALSVSVAGGESGTTASTTAAGGLNVCNGQADARPCGYATAAPSGTITETLSLPLGVGDAALVQVAGTNTASTAFADRVAPGAADGSQRESVTRVLPDISIGGLPSGISAPAGWNGYWLRLTGFTATVRAEAGINTNAPSVSVGGTISAWNGNGYRSYSVTAAGGAIALTPVNITAGSGASAINIQISGTMKIDPSSMTEEILSGSTRTSAAAIAGSPLTGAVTYVITRGGATMANLSLSSGLGRASVQSKYVPPPQ